MPGVRVVDEVVMTWEALLAAVCRHAVHGPAAELSLYDAERLRSAASAILSRLSPPPADPGERVVRVDLRCVYGEGADLPTTVLVTGRGVCLAFDGYGDRVSSPDGEPVLVENRRGVPHVVVWGDVSREDPTDTVSLAGAAVAKAGSRS